MHYRVYWSDQYSTQLEVHIHLILLCQSKQRASAVYLHTVMARPHTGLEAEVRGSILPKLRALTGPTQCPGAD